MTAFEQGYEAHSKGASRESNPFDKERSPKMMVRWDQGWMAREKARR